MDHKSIPGVNNEEILEELMKNLKSSCVRVDEDCTSSNECAKSDANNDSLRKETCQYTKDNNAKCTTSNPHGPDTEPPRDFIDEELLKDREIDLTESEKEVCYIFLG